MQVKLSRLSKQHPNYDTIAVIDNDGRELAITRVQINQLINLLHDHKKRNDKELGEYLADHQTINAKGEE